MTHVIRYFQTILIIFNIHKSPLVLGYAYSFSNYCSLSCGKSNIICQRELDLCEISDENCFGRPGIVTSLTDTEREEVIKVTNEFRQSYARQNNISNMNALVYSKELEFTAQCWINSCLVEPPKCTTSPKFLLDSEQLYGESQESKISLENLLKKQLEKERKGHASNFGETKVFGCGLMNCSNSAMYLSCHFYPAMKEGEKYGSPCLGCSNKICSMKYPGLCPETIVVDAEFERPYLEYSLNHFKLCDKKGEVHNSGCFSLVGLQETCWFYYIVLISVYT